uniref:Uncharacterized protein n=1 Tax=Anguilla anguilla TaxID=7936 RepID=A0A0E9XXH3_ANGAN
MFGSSHVQPSLCRGNPRGSECSWTGTGGGVTL